MATIAGGVGNRQAAMFDPNALKLKRQIMAEKMQAGKRPKPAGQVMAMIDFLQRTDIQFIFYIVFLYCFTELTASCRDPDEYFFSNDIRSTYITQGFDGDHDQWADINRFADFWEWTNFVLVPGLFSQTGNAQYGDDTGEGWPDQSGDHDGLLGYTTEELRMQSSYHDFAGVQFRQIRVKPTVEEAGRDFNINPTLMDVSMPGLDMELEDKLDTATYGVGKDAWGGFLHYTADELYDVENLGQTPFSYSSQSYPGGGFASVMVPFYATEILDDVVGDASDHGFKDLIQEGKISYYYSDTAKYRCLRVSLNGNWIEQTCDPSPNENKCKDLAYKFMRRMREGHWLDWRTRYAQVSIQLKSPNANMDATLNMHLEFPGDGGILTSYKIDLAPNTVEQKDRIVYYRDAVVFFITFQLFFECLEFFYLAKSGSWKLYVTDAWNWLDILNLWMMIYSVNLLNNSILSEEGPEGEFHLSTGYVSNARTNREFQTARVFLAINTMLQFLKLIKFGVSIYPQMAIVTRVLEAATSNILYYGITICLSTFAAAFYMNMIVGGNIGDFYSFFRSFQTILRSIFGDFDIDSVDAVTASNSITWVYLIYLCVMTWIIVSYFFSILADAQARVNEKIEAEIEEGVKSEPHFVIRKINAYLGRIVEGEDDDETKRAETPEGEGADDEHGTGEPLTREMIIGQVQALKDGIVKGEKPKAEIQDGDLDNDGVEDINQGVIHAENHMIPMPEFVVKFKRFMADRYPQLVMYICQLTFITLLGYAVRTPTQYYLSRNVVALYIEGGWNDDHEEMADVRTPADLWEWGIACTIPSIFSNTDNMEAWPDGLTSWPDDADDEMCADGGWNETSEQLGDCSGETWEFAELGATPYTISELQEVFATMHADLHLQMVRAEERTPDKNHGYFDKQGDYMEPDVEKAVYGYGFDGDEGSVEHERQKFHYLSTTDLGYDDDAGMFSPLSESSRTYTLGGYNAFIMPFFSTVYLSPDCADGDDTCAKSANEGFSAECLLDQKCTDFLIGKGVLSASATPEEKQDLMVLWAINGDETPKPLLPSERRHGSYQCVRTSLNGIWMRQVCDPVSKESNLPIEGTCKDHVYNMWQELQDHHYIDFQTRALVMSLQTYSANTKLESYAKMVFEFPLSGGITPSSLVSTARTDGTTNAEVGTWLYLSLTIFVSFLAFEVLCLFEEGPAYFRSVWNWLDIVNFVLFLMMYISLSSSYIDDETLEVGEASSRIVQMSGWHERHTYFGAYDSAIRLLAMNLLLLYMKAIKILLALVPKCKELIDVLSYCFAGLLSLSVVIILTVVGFALMFWVLLGSTMSGFADKERAIITMMRASLGDFDVASIDENSPSESNLMLFLFGVTAVQFILLSMFFSILGDAQAEIIARNQENEMDEFAKMAEAQEKLEKMAEAMGGDMTNLAIGGVTKGLSRGLSFLGGSNKELNQVAPEPEAAKDAELSGPPEEEVKEIDLLEENSKDPEVIKKQVGTLREELEGLMKMIEGRYLDESNPDCLDKASDAEANATVSVMKQQSASTESLPVAAPAPTVEATSVESMSVDSKVVPM